MSRSSPPLTFITSITNVNGFRYRILSIPDGYRLFRTDIISSGPILFIPSGCRTSEAFQAHLYSSAVFPVLDRTRHHFIPHFDQTPKVSHYLLTADSRVLYRPKWLAEQPACSLQGAGE